MLRTWLPRLVAALGFAGLFGTAACYPLKLVTVPLGSPVPDTTPTRATARPSMPVPEAVPTSSPALTDPAGPAATPSLGPAATPSLGPAATPSPAPSA